MENLTSNSHQTWIAFNLLMCIFTCGAWLPIWGAIEIIRYVTRRR